MAPKHFLRLGTHAEKEYLKRLKTFDEVVLNANLIEATTEAMSVFALQMRNDGHPFVIDPYTHAFAVEPSQIHSDTQPHGSTKPRVKQTFESLSERFGIPLGDSLGLKSLQPSDLNPVLEDVVARVLAYQKDRLSTALEENEEFLGTADDAESLKPKMVLAPYFVDEFDSAWREINKRAINIASQIAGAEAAGVIAFDSRSAKGASLKGLADEYSGLDVSNYFIWPTDFDERVQTEASLRDYADFVSALSSSGKTLTAFYGGFFALLLHYRGLGGVSHGVGYGDKRGMEPVSGGGVPPPMFYVRAVRDVVRLGDVAILAANLSPDEYRTRICACTICEGLMAQDGVPGLLADLTETEFRTTARGEIRAVPAREVYKRVKWHFLLNRMSEVAEIGSTPLDDLVARMRGEAQWAASRLGARATAHVHRWIAAVS